MQKSRTSDPTGPRVHANQSVESASGIQDAFWPTSNNKPLVAGSNVKSDVSGSNSGFKGSPDVQSTDLEDGNSDYPSSQRQESPPISLNGFEGQGTTQNHSVEEKPPNGGTPRPPMHYYSVAATSLFLATKVEENCRKMKELVIACVREALTARSEKPKEAPSTESPESPDATLDRSSATMSVTDLGPGFRELPVPPGYALTESMAVPPNRSIPQPVSPERTRSQAKAYAVELDDDTIEIQESQSMVSEESGASRDATYLVQPTGFKSIVKMVIHLPNERLGTRIGKLDTGSKFDVISEEVIDTLGIKMGPYLGPNLRPIGPDVKPLGSIKLDWHVFQREKTYTTTFVVLNTNLSKGFDILLSEDTIGKVSFYNVNNSVWFSQLVD